MESYAFKFMSIDELWNLHEQVISTLTDKIAAEKATLEERLYKIDRASNFIRLDRVRRPYPKVLPKYRNPQNPAETWSGRGKQPRWLGAQLRAGKNLNKFLIVRSSTETRKAQ
ncbi:MAG TPA: H-NS histone family protein [Candidatus Acidoferrum sp.]|jgi:DNA-binding protein H-NS|nr:H-NS histone family protein [Candidatus Acidoferrum sp.]